MSCFDSIVARNAGILMSTAVPAGFPWASVFGLVTLSGAQANSLRLNPILTVSGIWPPAPLQATLRPSDVSVPNMKGRVFPGPGTLWNQFLYSGALLKCSAD